MSGRAVVGHAEWVKARIELLAREKELTRMRDAVSRARRELPWERVDKAYAFDAPGGTKTLAELFDGKSQLLVYHFMFEPEWDEGCKSCSFIADHYDPSVIHLRHRDVSLVTISKAPLEKLLRFQQRMGWRFPWVSSFKSDFNEDFHVSFPGRKSPEEPVYYNYTRQTFPAVEAPGASVFVRDPDGAIFHTYSIYSRGLDLLIGAYNWLDLVPKGRDEENLAYGMEWVRHHDRYEDSTFVDPYKKFKLDQQKQ